MIVIDTGPIIAAANRKDSSHQQCVELLETFPGPLLLPQPLLAETATCWPAAPVTRPRSIPPRCRRRRIRPGSSKPGRRQPSSAPRGTLLRPTLGTADAVVVAVAERYGAATIATLDRRHFSVVRPSHVSALTLLP